jgi:hypothetical protein
MDPSTERRAKQKEAIQDLSLKLQGTALRLGEIRDAMHAGHPTDVGHLPVAMVDVLQAEATLLRQVSLTLVDELSHHVRNGYRRPTWRSQVYRRQ